MSPVKSNTDSLLGRECENTYPILNSSAVELDSYSNICMIHDVGTKYTSNTEGSRYVVSSDLSVDGNISVRDPIDHIVSSTDKAQLSSGTYVTSCDVSYTDFDNTIPLCPNSIRLTPRHSLGGINSQMNGKTWEYYLQFEPNLATRDYLSVGIQEGFSIVDDDACIDTYSCDNYSSVCSGPAFDYINKVIMQEIIDGKYVRADFVPKCVHALGAVPKSDGTFRPITDCRRPIGVSINNYMSTTCEEFSYASVDQVASNMAPGCFMASVDIAAAYRSVSINPSQWTLQGIKWDLGQGEEYLLDTRICFGLRCAPFAFTQISNFVRDTMQRLGYICVINYLDDFMVFGQDFQECQTAQTILVTLLGQLGFSVSWKKCTSPSQTSRYLGVIFDSVNMRLILPEDKMNKLFSELRFFEDRNRATKKQLQRLCGILSYCSKVIKGARTFSRRVIDLLKALPNGNPRIRLTNEFKADLDWWRKCASMFNGHAYVIRKDIDFSTVFYTDSSLTGYGVVSDNDWLGGFFNSELIPFFSCSSCVDYHWYNVKVVDQSNINYLELIPVYVGLLRLAQTNQNQHLLCYSDNTQVVSMINKGTSVNPLAMELLREIFWITVQCNIHLTARHVPGVSNVTADYISRISNDMYLLQFPSYLCCSI